MLGIDSRYLDFIPYAIIGTGADIARFYLTVIADLSLTHLDESELMIKLYIAKKLAEKEVSVGSQTDMFIMSPNDNIKYIGQDELLLMEKIYNDWLKELKNLNNVCQIEFFNNNTIFNR